MEPTEMTSDYKYCNHHHELTDRHAIVEMGGCQFVANVEAIPLLKALNDAGLKTRTHHHTGDGWSFVSILLDNATIEVRRVFERDADRVDFDGRYEALVSWNTRA